jgi:hypothetical protein
MRNKEKGIGYRKCSWGLHRKICSKCEFNCVCFKTWIFVRNIDKEIRWKNCLCIFSEISRCECVCGWVYVTYFVCTCLWYTLAKFQGLEVGAGVLTFWAKFYVLAGGLQGLIFIAFFKLSLHVGYPTLFLSSMHLSFDSSWIVKGKFK